ncbi:hypothetical protein GCM10027451_34490 [Geodermatophilus aquaeductus]|uniref:DUF6779 domain-containing protein n=2 Tax=Geodermatophilus aquaeductus TaxID=1564161 RepID=A0A521CVX0_9ACTN|nr:hypothetical protein SAMN06273567_102717 [Geodermatophilus aquaeductus]
MRVAGLLVGCVAAAAATAVVFLSDDPQVLRVAVVAVAWACLGAAFATGRRPEAAAAEGRDVAAVEAELRRTYDAELEREAAVHRQAELELELQVRGEAEAAMRRELDGLRSELAGLRGDLTGLDALRTEVAAVGALRADLAALAGLRADLAELAGLRGDVGRLRAELTERQTGELHHAGEMHVERVVMRTQSVRTGREPLEPATASAAQVAWHADVTRELGGWPGTGAPATVAVPVVSPDPEPVARVLTPPPVPVDTGAPRRRRTDLAADLLPPAPAEQLTAERPSVHAAAAGHGGYAVPPAEEEAGSARLAQILAESGVTPGGRRRRYRD